MGKGPGALRAACAKAFGNKRCCEVLSSSQSACSPSGAPVGARGAAEALEPRRAPSRAPLEAGQNQLVISPANSVPPL